MLFLIKDEIRAQKSAGINAVFDMDNWFARATIDIAGEAGFGSRFDALTHPFTPLNKAYRSAFIVDATSRASSVHSFLSNSPIAKLLPSRRVRERAKGYELVKNWIRGTIEERKKDMYHNVDDVDYLDRAGHTDIISAMMKDGKLSIDNLVQQALAFLGAGPGKCPLSSTETNTNETSEISVCSSVPLG